ncbi:MAG TPA: hypothetical protein VLB44_12135 [Kofleriaceae bacterium]|nr:hypothetical protein [Kofleriaceae bacterium]
MARIVVILSIVLAGCDVGSINNAGATDANGSGSGSGSGSGGCETISASPPDGHHNEGQSCIAAACHLATALGTNAPAFAYAGTMYTTSAGTTPMVGATVFIKFKGVEKKVITASNGNFFMSPGVAGLDSPSVADNANTRVSGCPTVSTPMSGPLQQGGGNCNNCHKIGGTTSPIYIGQ